MERVDEVAAEGDGVTITTPTSVGEVLHLLRFRARLSRDDVSKRAKVGMGTLSRYENDVTTRPDPALLRRLVMFLADECGVDGNAVWQELGVLMDRRTRQAYAEAVAASYDVRRDRKRKRAKH